MHIPDGYMSPATCATFTAAMTPVWATAGKRVRKVVKQRYVPLVAIGAAYSFLVMMFNVPVPDGTSAHAVGAVLIAIVLGPWAAVIAVSIALAIQALFFGDGGVLAFAVNAFNMAFAMPVIGYFVYRALGADAALDSRRRAIAAGIAGFVGINVAALLAAIEFGLQPVLFHAANGTPLYAPYHLSQSIPAMMLAHLVVAGPVEFAMTAGVFAYLQRTNLALLRINHPKAPPTAAAAPPQSWLRRLFIGLTVMAVATPLGVLASSGAFGENAPTSRRFWRHALLDGYRVAGLPPAISALLSALLVLAIAGGLVLTVRVVRRRRLGIAS